MTYSPARVRIKQFSSSAHQEDQSFSSSLVDEAAKADLGTGRAFKLLSIKLSEVWKTLLWGNASSGSQQRSFQADRH